MLRLISPVYTANPHGLDAATRLFSRAPLRTEPIERVGDNVGMQNAVLEAGQKLVLKILPANQKIVLANTVATLSIHNASSKAYGLISEIAKLGGTAELKRTFNPFVLPIPEFEASLQTIRDRRVCLSVRRVCAARAYANGQSTGT